MVSLRDIETPAAIVDVERCRSNARRVADYCRQHGLSWRPHIKTHKSRDIARIELEAGAAGLTVATLREAEVMAEVSEDILLAYPPVGEAKLGRLAGLVGRVQLKVALDEAELLAPLDRVVEALVANGRGRRVGVLVELDVGGRRVGVGSPEEAVALARRISACTALDYAGIIFHPGHVRAGSVGMTADLDALAAKVRSFVNALTDAGLRPAIVSGGSTPTLWQSHAIPELTEIRPGTCIFYDRDTVVQGVAEISDCAYTVLATVVSTAVPGQVVVDAGSKALAKEGLPEVKGFGMLLDQPDVVVKALSEEHGIIDLSETDFSPQVGDRLRIVPNHVCVSVNLQDALFVERNGQLESWPIAGRGRGPFSR